MRVVYSNLYEEFIAIYPSENNPEKNVIKRFPTKEMALAFLDTRRAALERESVEKKFWWNK